MSKQDSEDAESRNQKEEQSLDQMVEQAVNAAARGENIEQLLDVMLASVSPQAKDKLRKKYSAALAKRKMRQPSGEADVIAHSALARIRDLFAATGRQALERVKALLKARPDIAKVVAQAGQVLAKNGVVIDRVQISEADLGQMAPMAGVGQGQGKGQGGRSAS